MSGRLQQAEQTNGDLLAQMAEGLTHRCMSKKGLHAAKSPHTASSAPAYMEAGPSGATPLIQEQSGIAPTKHGQPRCALSEESSSHHLLVDAAQEAGSNDKEEPCQESCVGEEESHDSETGSASHSSSCATSAAQSAQQQQSQVPGIHKRQSEEPGLASERCTDRPCGTSSSSDAALHQRLQAIADTLASDVVRLKKVVDSSSSCEAEAAGNKAANWGFSRADAEGSRSFSRPVTAGAIDGTQRANRQWSAGSARLEPTEQHASHHRQTRPVTAAAHDYAKNTAGLSPHDAVDGRPSLGVNKRSRQHREQFVWREPVPPTRMPEEILQQAREDYLMEKNRVREKRLHELAAKSGNGITATDS